MKLIFYNNFNNGDIHVSREFIKDIIKKTKVTDSIYYHKNSNRILLDISDLICIPIKDNKFPTDKHIFDYFNIIYINTWYNSIPENYQQFGCTLETLYENFKSVYSFLKLEIEPLEYYIPEIDYSKYNISEIDSFFRDHHGKKKIFISNCRSLSGQSPSINWDNLILNLSDTFQDYLFFITNPSNVEKRNCISAERLIGNLENNLCEQSYISTLCDVIIGNNSGPHTFTYVKENIIGKSNQQNIMISYYPTFIPSISRTNKQNIQIGSTGMAAGIIIDKIK